MRICPDASCAARALTQIMDTNPDSDMANATCARQSFSEAAGNHLSDMKLCNEQGGGGKAAAKQ